VKRRPVILLFVGLATQLLAFDSVASGRHLTIPIQFRGTWKIEAVPQDGFPWAQVVKYPVKLKLDSNSGIFYDQEGGSCRIPKFGFDPQTDRLAFTYCGGNAYPDISFEIIHLASVNGDHIEGLVRDHRDLFRWQGVRVRTKPPVSKKSHHLMPHVKQRPSASTIH